MPDVPIMPARLCTDPGAHLTLGEGPIWDPVRGTLLWVDIARGIVLEGDLVGGRVRAAVADAIAAHGGTVSHQHGVGRDHAAHLADEKGPLGMATLAGLCRHFDPHGIMNPGKLLQDGGPWAN